MKLDSMLSPGLLKSNLKRFWPLWLVGLIGLVLLIDVPLYGAAGEIARSSQSLAEQRESMVGAFATMRLLSWAYALVGSITVALVLHEHLFDGRAATFVGSLPVRRPAVCASVALSGLLMLLALPLLAAIALLPLRAMLGAVLPLAEIARWYGFTTLFVVVLYATALVSCHLAGTRAVALLLYFVINFLAVCLEAATQMAISALVYGMASTGELFDWASPAAWLLGTVITWDVPGVPSAVPGVACYVLSAVVMTVLSGWLFCRRDLETAGDSVAVRQLRPVLGVLAGASMALLFSSVYHLTHLFSAASGLPMTRGEATVMAVLMAVGAWLGVLIAEMIMRRSTHVLAYCWRTGLALAAASIVFVGACWFDVTGAGHYVPDATEVEKVSVQGNWSNEFTLTSPEAIASACDLQRDAIAYGGVGDRNGSTFDLMLTYRLKSGRVVHRSYPIISSWFDTEEEPDVIGEGDALVKRFIELADSPEGRAARYAELLEGDLSKLSCSLEYRSDDGAYEVSADLPADELDGLFEALRHDLLEDQAGEVLDQHDWADGYDATLNIQTTDEEGRPIRNLLSMQLCDKSCPQTVAWFVEHHPEIELQPWA